jgi:hypothetical protein
MAFEPGQSGNPGGRKDGNTPVRRLARENSIEAIEKLLEWMRSDNPKASVSACNAILDRAYGKPAQPISGDEENPIQIAAIAIKLVKSDGSA